MKHQGLCRLSDYRGSVSVEVSRSFEAGVGEHPALYAGLVTANNIV